ncbi:Myotubularin-related protein 6 [Schistosoma japonicum]|nr:Myotubularin-related protein 6 [Schistosoma japonicum]
MDKIAVTQVNDVFYIDQFDGNAHIRGTLHLTLTHLFFLGLSRKQEIWLPNQLISSVERLPLTTGGAPLVIHGKDFRVLRLIVLKERDCHDVYVTLTRLLYVAHVSDLPCFRFVPPDCYWSREEGWSTFSLESQFSRFGLPNSFWTLTNVNKNFEICDTYPLILYVPSMVSRNILYGSSRFRSRGRFPVLTYLHPNGKSALCRSSQPLAGFSSKSTEDQVLLEAIRNSNPDSSILYIVDTRPAINALTNRAQGKGYEDTNVYRNVVIQFFDIENIHVVRSSLEKLLKVCCNPTVSLEQFTSGLNKSGWLKHLHAILEAAYFVAKRLDEGNSVLVHCSDGWDRTAQVCALAQIILDPYYRTFLGLQALIEKDWIQFGYKFTERCGLVSNIDSREISPIFTQFLDCLQHLLEICPTKFEYNTKLLKYLHDQIYSAVYGTFIGCNEKERINLEVRHRTYSLWAYLDRSRDKWINPFYEHNSVWTDFSVCGCGSDPHKSTYFDTDELITVGIELIDDGKGNSRYAADILPAHVLCAPLFRLWRDLYLRWEWRLPKYDLQRESHVSDYLSGLTTLLDHNRLLEARIGQLQELLNCKIAHSNNSCINSNSSSTNKSITSMHVNGDEESEQTTNNVSNSSHNQHVQTTVSTTNNSSHSCILTKQNSISNDWKQLSQPNFEQLKCEMDIINVNWSPCVKPGSLCCICNSLLALSNQSVHCHSCGLLVCSRCLHPNLPTIPSLWSTEQKSVQFCNSCASKLRNITNRSSSSSSHIKHFTQSKSVEMVPSTTVTTVTTTSNLSLTDPLNS